MSSNHSRNPSEETNATSMSYILEHVLQYPGSYEIPLRTMYALNCAPPKSRRKDASRAPTPTGNGNGTLPSTGQPAWNDAESATMNFTSQLMSHIGSLPTHRHALPPSFLVSFINRCFHPTLSLVDFPQALTALDYLRDLETRRRKEMLAAYERIHIRPDSFESDIEGMGEQFPGITLWAKNLQMKHHKAESFYAQIWIGLRRWIIINELSLQPFNKLNCMGMLNTLLPPMPPGDNKPSAPGLSTQVLRQERDNFFHYIQLVQKNGPSALREVMELNAADGDENGWSATQRIVDRYLRVAKNMIDDCLVTTSPDDFRAVEEQRKSKKTDSGISFGSQDRRPSTGSVTKDKPLPDPHDEPTPAPKNLSKLERITREFKRMRVKTRPDVEEIVKVESKKDSADMIPMAGDHNKGKKIKKARSLANLGNLRGANASSTSLAGSRKGSEIPAFNPEEMQRHRMMYEASNGQNKGIGERT